MLGRSQQYIYDHPHLAVYPALCIILVALGFTLHGRVAARGPRPQEQEVTRR